MTTHWEKTSSPLLRNATSVTLLVKGQNKYTLMQIKEAIIDGLRLTQLRWWLCRPSAGAVGVAVADDSLDCIQVQCVRGREPNLGVQVLLVSAHYSQGSCSELGFWPSGNTRLSSSRIFRIKVSLWVWTGTPRWANGRHAWDDRYVKNQLHHSSTITATNILLVDEFIRAGMSPLKGKLNWSFPCIIWITREDSTEGSLRIQV